jgi:hypothetical protein
MDAFPSLSASVFHLQNEEDNSHCPSGLLYRLNELVNIIYLGAVLGTAQSKD